MPKQLTQHLQLPPDDNERLNRLCGPLNAHIDLIERYMEVSIHCRGHVFDITGAAGAVNKATALIEALYDQAAHDTITEATIYDALNHTNTTPTRARQKTPADNTDNAPRDTAIYLRQTTIKARTPTQHTYLQAMHDFDINFGIGPAGTGKTFLAVAQAVSTLEREQVKRIILVRPAVEAGESLGFLPGDLAQKVDPYLRPLYDGLYEMMGGPKVSRLIEKGIIEIAPLAYMRGRTLSNAFIILDEGQNTTRDQMKMFLTRIGFGSKAVITGDITQVDLPKKVTSGLRHAMTVLKHIDAIRFTQFKTEDVVRHPLVQRVIEAYEAQDDESHHYH